MQKMIEQFTTEFPYPDTEKHIFEEFKENRTLLSDIPANFHLAKRNVSNQIKRSAPIQPKRWIDPDDKVVLQTANKLFDFEFENYHEALCLLQYATTISLIKASQSQDDIQLEKSLLLNANQEFDKFRTCIFIGDELQRGKFSISPFDRVIIKILFPEKHLSKKDRLIGLITSAEEYFANPQVKARITLLAQ